jgi:hypothetical protein
VALEGDELGVGEGSVAEGRHGTECRPPHRAEKRPSGDPGKIEGRG